MKQTLVFILLCFIIIHPSSSQPAGPGQYCNVGDARIYYEVHGSGPPVVLLHGGLFGSIAEFSGLINDLKDKWTLVAIATRGHEKSEPGTLQMSYQLQAEDYAKVMMHLKLEPAVVIGFSDGAIASYHLASAYPQLVKKLIAVGGPLGLTGYTQKGRESLKYYDSPEALERSAPKFVKSRRETMVDSVKWNKFCTELAAMWKSDQYIAPDDFKKIKCPTLLIAGDRDEYTSTDHIIKARDMLAGSQLAIIPGSGHTVFDSKPRLMSELVQDFLRK